MNPLDPRITPARPDLAAKHLEGKVQADRFVEGVMMEVVAPQAPVRREPSPDAIMDTEALKGERVIEDQGLIVIAQRVVGRGSEMHDNTNHVFIIMDGEAEFITGGKFVNPKATEPGQTRGTGIEGGVSHHLTKGDVITIPAKTPHQWKDTSKTGSVGYFTVNLVSN